MSQVGTPVGPRKLTKVRQVAIPARLLEELNLDAGSEVYFSMSETSPKRILIIPGDQIDDGQGRVSR